MRYLDKLNLKAREERPHALKDTIATMWGIGTGFVQLCFQSRGCRYSDLGACVMCDYGCGRNLEDFEIKSYFQTETVFRNPDVKEILIGTYGSSLDEYEISSSCFDAILEGLKRTEIPMVGFETHCDTVNFEKLNKIKGSLPNKEIYIEMGFESLDDNVRERFLNKRLNVENLKRAMTLVHQFGFQVILNIIIGSPFLTPGQQVKDVSISAKWAFEHGADHIVLFPMNIKPYTILYKMTEKGMYKPISHWRIIQTLSVLGNTLTRDQLAHTGLSWYGERTDIYQKPAKQMITPIACDVCKDSIFDFYHAYQSEMSGDRRCDLIEEIKTLPLKCHCREEEIRLEAGLFS